jgi:hypothetical protein
MNAIKHILTLVALGASVVLSGQGVGINLTGANPDPSAVLDMNVTDRGFLTPRMTKAQRDAIAAPATGLLIYQTDAPHPGFRFYDGTDWVFLRGRVSVPGRVAVAAECASTSVTAPAVYGAFSNVVNCPTGTGTVTWGAGLFDQPPTVNMTPAVFPVPPPAPSNYCVPSYSALCNVFFNADQIEGVRVQTGNSATGPWTTVMINNNSGCNLQPGNYIAYPPAQYTCTLSGNNGAPGCSNNWFRIGMRSSVEWNDNCHFYIDWNQNGSFIDPGEGPPSQPQYNLGQTGIAGAWFDTPGLQVPPTALNGNTILRARSVWVYSTNPCQGGTFGETEDYTITINCSVSGPAPEVATVCQITAVTTTSFSYKCNLLSGLAIAPSINFELLKNE